MSSAPSHDPTENSMDQGQQGNVHVSSGVTPEKQDLIGYPKLARLMGHSPETAIFRRFKELNLINLLRLQAELQDMEHQLQGIRDDDAQSSDQVRASYATDFRLMRDWKETGDSLQYDLLVSIGDKVQEYSLTLSFRRNRPHQINLSCRRCAITGTGIEQSWSTEP